MCCVVVLCELHCVCRCDSALCAHVAGYTPDINSLQQYQEEQLKVIDANDAGKDIAAYVFFFLRPH
jgi:hypothetical protein